VLSGMSEKKYRDRDGFAHEFYCKRAKRSISKSEKHARRKLERSKKGMELD
jgi:hypothetical protein